MYTEPDEAVRRLQHEKSVWRAIAIGLAATLVLLLALGGIAGLFLAKRSQQMRAEEAEMRAVQERDRAEAERRGAEEKKAKLPAKLP